MNGPQAESVVPVECLFNVGDKEISRTQATEVAISADQFLVDCASDHIFTEEATYNVGRCLC